MNSVIEESKKLKESIQSYQAKIPNLKEGIIEMTRAQLELDEEALKAEILEDRGWEKKKERAAENRAKISEMKAEIEKAEKAIEILNEKIKKLSPAIMKEFKKKFYKKCADDLKEYGKHLKVAAEFEAGLIEKRRDIEREIRTALSNGVGILGPVSISSTIIPAFRPILTAGPFTPKNMSQYLYFLETCEEQGINIE